ncbi:MAG: hypothetical protein GY865_19740 [candidate division Zixibacteria bacterium]|nr:hypothetical protein [candidate division Zixibacteria bacterium]
MCTIQRFGFKAIFLCLLTILIISGCSKDDPAGPSGEWVWSPLGDGVDDRVFAMIEYDGNLIVGGFFDNAGEITVNNIAAWNDTTWSALGSGIIGEVAAFTIYDDKLIVGGNFTYAGGTSANNIAVWDGTSWSTLGTGFNGRIRALGVYVYPEGHAYAGYPLLIAGGEFTQAGGNTSVRNLAAWDGNNWGWTAVNIDGPVHSICETGDGMLYIGGDFVQAKFDTCNSIFFFDMDAESMGNGMKLENDEQGSVFAILEHENKIYAGGIFDSASGVPANNVAVFGATSGWTICGHGTSHGPFTSDVRALTTFDNKVIAGGYFEAAGGLYMDRIASWNGTKWSPLGLGVDGPNWPHIWALMEYNGKLIAGGRFTSAGDSTANNIAAWHFVPD